MTPEDKARIVHWRNSVADPIRIGRIRSESRRVDPIQRFCDAFAELVPAVTVTPEDPETGPSPSIRVRDNLTFQIVPSERELEPFLLALHDADGDIGLAPGLAETLAGLPVPAMLTAYVATQCPFCPNVVKQLVSVAKAGPMVHVNIIDAALFSDAAGADRIRSVPTVILDDTIRWTGALHLDEVADMMVDREPARLSADTFIKLLQEGDAEAFADMMADSHTVYPAFFDLITHPKWPVRLGAMVTFEYLAEKNRALATECVDTLLEQLPRIDDAVKGDVLHLIGQSGHAPARRTIEALIAGGLPDDLREAAEDALLELKESDPPLS